MNASAVDYAQLSMASELLKRQREHTTLISNYLDAQCCVSSADFGMLLQVLHPVNELIVDGASRAMDGLGSLAEWPGSQMSATLDAYVAVDRDTHEHAAALMQQLGVSLPPFSDPRGDLPALGGATSHAASDYGYP